MCIVYDDLTLTINFKLFTIKCVNILNIVLGNILSVSLWCLRNVAEAAVLTVAAAPFRNDGHFVYQRLLWYRVVTDIL